MNPGDRERERGYQHVDDNRNEDDDDFGDFGGFEGADPVPDMPVSQAQAASSPWAILTTGTASGRPDLLCAQNRFPTVLDPSDIATAPVASRNANLNNQAQVPPHPAQVDLFNGDFPHNAAQVNQARIAEGVLDGTLNVAAGTNFLRQSMPGRLPDIGLGINENRLFGQIIPAATAGLPGNLLGAEELLVHPPAPVEDETGRVAERAEPGGDAVAEDVEPVEQVAEAGVGRAQQVVENAAERRALEEQLQSLSERNESLDAELVRCQEELNSAQSRLQAIQTRHEAELAEIRKSGSDALAVVVEQYKEQTKVLVAEQQELAKRQLLETQRQQMKVFQDMLDSQRALQEQQQERERLEVERRISHALEEGRQKQEGQFEAFLQAEKEKQKTVIEEAIETERKTCEERLQGAISSEQDHMRSEMESFKACCSQQLDEEIQGHKTALQNVRQEETDIAKEQMSELCKEEREVRREAIQTALSEARQDQSLYFEEQRQADARLRRRHYTSLDIFLESSRQQIALLLDAENKDLQGAESGSTQDDDKDKKS